MNTDIQSNATMARLFRAGEDRTRVLIASARGLFQAGLESLIETSPRLAIVGRVHDADEMLSLIPRLNPELVLLSMDLPRLSKRVMTELESHEPPVQTVVVASRDSDQSIEVFRTADRIVSAASGSASLLQVVHNAVDEGRNKRLPLGSGDGGKTPAPLEARPQNGHESTRSSPRKADPGKPPFGLTRREIQVIVAITEGQTNRDIADTLSISLFTVKHHLTRIFDKVGVFNRLELALFAVNHNLAQYAVSESESNASDTRYAA